jgi:hypothetical protein
MKQKGVKQMEYSQARGLIATGDLIAVRTASGLLGRATQFFTRGPYTHTGLALWLCGRLFMTEINGGRNHLVPLSQLNAVDFDVYAHPPELDPAALDAAIHEWLAARVDYGYLAFVAIGLLEWLRLKLTVPWRKILVCSGYCVANWESAGWHATCSRVVSPTKLAAQVRRKFTVQASPLGPPGAGLAGGTSPPPATV